MGRYEVRVNLEWCKACGLCSWICPTKAITSDQMGKPVVDTLKCVGCLSCEKICPEFAIDVVLGSDDDA